MVYVLCLDQSSRAVTHGVCSVFRPIINNKFEEKTCGEGPSLGTMFEDDKHLQTIIHSIREAITAAFRAASQYADTFEPHREFYKENESTDLDLVRSQDHGMNLFKDITQWWTF